MSNTRESEDYEPVDEDYRKVVSQVDNEERMWSLYTDLRDFVEYSSIPLLENINMEKISEFISSLRRRDV